MTPHAGESDAGRRDPATAGADPVPPARRGAPVAHWFDGVRGGDRSAFDALFDRHYEALCAFVYRFVRDAAEAEDLVQEVFLRLWARRETLDPTGGERAYLFVAARNRALNHLRRRRLERRWRESRPADRAAVAPHAEDDLRDRTLAEALERAVASLPARTQEAFRLSREHHLTYREIAEIMGISQKTVEEHVGRALERLRDRLSPLLPQLRR